MAITAFKHKNDEVLDHWISFADGLHIPPTEFYKAVEDALAQRKVPKMELSHPEYGEGGLLSENRVYMRMIRERLAFDLCAAPFGNAYFFSCRTIYSPPVVRLWHLLAVCFGLGVVFLGLNHLLGFVYANIALVALLIALAQVFQNAIGMGLSDLDNLLMKIPAIGPIYERFFRKETYFRQDTRLVYLKLVPDIIKQVADEVAGTKGIKLLQQYERAPVLGELYKRVEPHKKEPEK